MYCNHCGKQIADDAKFCVYCGKPNSKPLVFEFVQIAENFALDEKRKKVMINGNIYDFSEIVGARVVENGTTAGTTTMNSNMGVGTVMGNQLIMQINLEIELNHFDNPFISIPFLKLGILRGVDTWTSKYKIAHKKAHTCLSILNKIIRDNEK